MDSVIRAWQAIAPDAREWLSEPRYQDGLIVREMLGITVQPGGPHGSWVALDLDDLEAIGRALASGWSTPATELARLHCAADCATEDGAAHAAGWIDESDEGDARNPGDFFR